MKVVYDQVADNGSCDEARKGEDVGKGVYVFMDREESGEGREPRKPVSRFETGGSEDSEGVI